MKSLLPPIIIVNKKYIVTYCSESCEGLFNCKLSEIYQSHFIDLCKRSRIKPPPHEVFKTLSPTKVTNKFQITKPDLIWLVSPLTDKVYKKTGYVIFANFVSQNNQYNTEIYLDNVVKHFPGFLYWKDKNSVYQGCNLNFAKAAGFNSPKTMIGKTDYDLAWGETEAELFRQGDQAALAGKTKYNFEEPQLQADGKKATVLASKAPLLDENGEIIGIIGTYLDITKQKQAEAEAIQAKEEALIEKQKAELANQAKTNFLATVSHELRTPLHCILGMTEILSTHQMPLDQMRELASDIYQSGSNLLSLINEILDFTKLEAGKMQLTLKTFNMKSLVENILNSIKHQLEDRPIKLFTTFSKNFPTELIGDELRVRQILVNLLGNAVKFTLKGHIKVGVQCISNNGSTATIQIMVADTGIGIPHDKLITVFDRFTQIDSDFNRRHQGAGLGLSICRQLVDLMNGAISANSKLNQGSTFTVSIPFILSKTTASKKKRQDSLSSSNYVPRKLNAYILLVEDHPLNQKVAKLMLDNLGCQTDIVNNGKDAILQAIQHQYDLILTDISLPDMDGMMITKKIRKLNDYYRQLPIIAVTAHVFEDRKKQFLNAGLNDILTKPIKLVELENVLLKWQSKSITSVNQF